MCIINSCTRYRLRNYIGRYNNSMCLFLRITCVFNAIIEYNITIYGLTMPLFQFRSIFSGRAWTYCAYLPSYTMPVCTLLALVAGLGLEPVLLTAPCRVELNILIVCNCCRYYALTFCKMEYDTTRCEAS